MADGSEETLIQQGVVMLNDMLDGQMALNVPGWLTSATEAASVSDPTVPIISGTLSHSVVIGNDVARIFTIDHDLGTTYPIVEVYTVSPFRRVPDNEYTTEIDDNAHVTLTFAVAVAAASLRVVIVNVEAQTVLNEHHHPIEEVDGLQDALDELAATFSTFEIATPLPLGMIPKLPWSKIGFPNVNSVNPVVIPDALLPTNIPRVDSSGFLPITTIPPEVPRLDAAGNLVVGVRGADGTITTKTILNVTTGSFDQSVIDRLVQDLANNAGFAEALISALALSGRTPPGITPMLIPDFELVYPPPRLIANAAGGAVRTYAPFPRAVGGPTSAGDVTGLIPLPDGTKKYYSVVGSAFSETNKGQRGQRFNNGDRVISDGVILYQGTSIIDAYYPAVFEREFFSLHVNPELLDVASKFFLSFTVNLQLEGNVAGACFVMLEIGEYVENAVTGTISAITWSEVFRHNIRLGPAAVVHYFDYAVTRSAGGVLTAKSTRYAKVNAAAVCPASASFAVRARLTEVDVDDTAPEPRGCLTCKVVGARATVSALS